MFPVWLAIFVICLLLLIHSYGIFPIWMMSKEAKVSIQEYPAYQPRVAIIVAAYNEEAVIHQKIQTTLDTDYPKDKLEIWIGSDCSNDNTDSIIADFASKDDRVKPVYFKERTGKPGILNTIVPKIQADVLILSDADTFFRPQTIPELVKPFSQQQIGGVQADINSYIKKGEEIGQAEKIYNDREFRIKKGESYYGSVIGAYGACYAIRKDLYQPIPQGFYVDDFYIFMKILTEGYHTIFASKAICDMEVSGKTSIQFKRKVRISEGNFQNFFAFNHFMNPFQSFPQFAFFSHKVIRWIGPFLMLIILLSNIFLALHGRIFEVLLAGQGLFYSVGLLDLLISQASINIKLFRYIRHFILMNSALLVGFFKFLKDQGDGKWD